MSGKGGEVPSVFDLHLFLQMAHCVTLVQLSISCDHLIDKDIGSKSDPLCVLLQDVGGGSWVEVRRNMRVRAVESALDCFGVEGVQLMLSASVHSLAELSEYGTAQALSSPRLCSLNITLKQSRSSDLGSMT